MGLIISKRSTAINHLFTPRTTLAALLVAVGLLRLGLLDRGAMALGDEGRYFASWEALASVTNGDARSFCKYLSSTQARPGDATLRLIPVAGQAVLYRFFGIHFFNPRSLLIATVINVLISVAVLYVFYRIALWWTEDYKSSLLATFMYALLVNTNLYVRHLLPYDAALLCFLLALYLTLQPVTHFPLRRVISIGLLTGFGFTVYPGFYFFPVVIVVAMHYRENSENVLPRLHGRRIVILMVAAAAVLLGYEGIARWGGTSYLFGSAPKAAAEVAESLQGSFEEGFTFVPKYLLTVEQAAGVVLLAGILLYLISGAIKAFTQRPLGLEVRLVLILTALAGLLLHATATYFFRRMLFEGRFLHMYYPFFVWATLAAVAQIPHTTARRIAYGSIIAVSVFCFVRFYGAYARIAYPRDVLYAQGISPQRNKYLIRVNESPPVRLTQAPPPLDSVSYRPYLTLQKGLTLVNFCYYHPVYAAFTPYQPSPNEQLWYAARHFLAYPAYGFEAYTIEERRRLWTRDYHVKIYVRPAATR